MADGDILYHLGVRWDVVVTSIKLLVFFMTFEQIAKLEEELASKNKAFRALEEKVRSQEDYEEIKRELG